ncbi:solute carrier family 35 member SLC35F1/F2/F6 [Mycena maculata]|uniref:Solute carrier family 35 member SLC35F1/F2/F6 n=1 Tax=Mycena maculata TaxID=230809 RepID=A0AAD7I206_9AGAR|nr:solute carrier family 35 member SLC35F1/F2/F6 [Mycena maculata]
MDSSDDKKIQLPENASLELPYNATPSTEPTSQRPPIDYTSVSAFFGSSARRFKSLWTRRFTLSLLAGQLVSLCITCTNVTTTELVNRHWDLSTTQNLFLYFSLFAVYTPYTMYRYGFVGWAKMVFRDGWKYVILAACDVEGNFMAVKAYQYTDLLSCMLLDAWAIPVCMFFSYLYMRKGYHWTQILGVFICITGLGLLVGSDELTKKDWVAAAKGKGDAFMVAGATLYGFTNATEEFFVRRRPLYEVVGQLGMWGTLICGAQAAGLEHRGMVTATWDGATIGLILAYTAALFILYTVAPLLYRMASSAYYNLSLLSSDWYGLIIGLGLYHYSPFWLYFVAFALVLIGLITYFWSSTPEEQGELDPKAPDYVNTRGAREETV